MVHLLFGPEVRLMLEENNTAEMKAFLETLHPATVAETLADELSVEQAWKFLEQTNIRHQAAIFEYFPIEWQVKMVEGTGRERMAHLIEQMSHDDRVDLLRRLMPRVAESLIRLVDEADRRDIATLVRQDANTAGGLMTTGYAWLPPNLTTTEALERLRLQAPNRETIYYIFILDEDHRLLGIVTLRELILAPRHALLRDIMDTRVISVRATDDRRKVADEMAHYDLLAIPVVDDMNRMVGIITHDDVMDVVVDEATEDLHRMGGVGPMTESYLQAGFATVWRKRAFWLSCLFVAELMTFWVMSGFEEAIAKFVVLSLFVPLVVSTGGNSGSQAATLITRAMALGQVSVEQWWKVLRLEVAMGLALGLSLGVIGFFRGYSTSEDVRSDIKKAENSFLVEWPADAELPSAKKGVLTFPKGTVVQNKVELDRGMQVTLPAGVEPRMTPQGYEIPAHSEVRLQAISRYHLAMVVGLSVAIICIWGTIIGSMLPIGFRKLGVDPGIASGPFVATFVDVTGILIYFSIASAYLL